MKQVECQVKKIIKDEGGARWTCNEMLKAVLFESESMLRKTFDWYHPERLKLERLE